MSRFPTYQLPFSKTLLSIPPYLSVPICLKLLLPSKLTCLNPFYLITRTPHSSVPSSRAYAKVSGHSRTVDHLTIPTLGTRPVHSYRMTVPGSSSESSATKKSRWDATQPLSGLTFSLECSLCRSTSSQNHTPTSYVSSITSVLASIRSMA